jgi:hypothetical protein
MSCPFESFLGVIRRSFEGVGFVSQEGLWEVNSRGPGADIVAKRLT